METEYGDLVMFICEKCGGEMQWEVTDTQLILSCDPCLVRDEIPLDDLDYISQEEGQGDD